MIPAVVLAAGAARRYGSPKQVLSHRGRPLVRVAVEAALGAGCTPVFVVIGAHADVVRIAIEDLPVRMVRNAAWKEGIASSIRRGVEHVTREPGAEAVLLLPCDLPHVDADVVRRLLSAATGHRESGVRTAACAYEGTVGPPAVFPRSRFERLLTLEGDRGAKTILLEEGPEIIRLEWPEGALDIDDPADRPLRSRGL